MILVVDAFNLIYKFPDLEEHMYRGDLEKARRGLLQYLHDYRRAWKKKLEIHVFIDGKKKHGDETRRETVSGMETYYSQDLSADHLIKEFIKRNPNPGNLTLVTSDKDIQFFARRFKVDIQTSEQFYKSWTDLLSDQAVSGEDEKPDMGETDTGFWMNLFRQGDPKRKK